MDALGGAGLAEVVVAVVALVAVVVRAMDGAVALDAVDGHAAQRVVSLGERLELELKLGNGLAIRLLGLLLLHLFADDVAELRGELGARAVEVTALATAWSSWVASTVVAVVGTDAADGGAGERTLSWVVECEGGKKGFSEAPSPGTRAP